MATRRDPWERLSASRGSDPADRLDAFAESAREARDADLTWLTDRVDRLRWFGCASGDMRLAYGWRAAVVTAALVALIVGLGTRLVLTGLFVEFVTGDVVPVTGFNLGVTVLATLTLGLARARRFRLAVHHRLVPVRRGLRRRYVRWRRSARQRRRHRVHRIAYRCRRTVHEWTWRVRTGQRRRRLRRTVRLSRWRRSIARLRRRVRSHRRSHRWSWLARVRRRTRQLSRRVREWFGRRRQPTARRGVVLSLLFGR